jgi:hypothetical protein
MARPVSHGTHHGHIEWAIVKLGRRGVEARHSEGAQTVFGLMRAMKIVRHLGEPWVVRHYSDYTREPTEDD